MSSHLTDFKARNKNLRAKLLQQGYRYHKFRNFFSKFYRRHFELVSKYNTGLRSHLQQGLSEPEFYGDLVHRFRKIVGKTEFSDQFNKIIVRYKLIRYNVDVMQQSACLVVNPITVNNFAVLFNCMPVGRGSDTIIRFYNSKTDFEHVFACKTSRLIPYKRTSKYKHALTTGFSEMNQMKCDRKSWEDIGVQVSRCKMNMLIGTW